MQGSKKGQGGIVEAMRRAQEGAAKKPVAKEKPYIVRATMYWAPCVVGRFMSRSDAIKCYEKALSNKALSNPFVDGPDIAPGQFGKPLPPAAAPEVYEELPL